MDSKTWIWKKRSPENTIVATGNSDLSLIENEEQVSLDEKESILRESLNLLNDKLASILRVCDGKDELVANYAKEAEKAMAGKEKAESEVIRLKEQLNEALRVRVADSERINQLNAALKGSRQQLDLVREEQEKTVYEAVITISKQLEMEHREASAGLSSLTAENSHLKMALIQKEMLVRDLSKYKAQTEEELDVLMEKIDSMEKENVFMRYEFRMLEKELDACNEEVKFSRYSLNASNNQNIESSKKMRELEEECQRLQGLLQKTRTTNLEPQKGGTVARNSVVGILPGNPVKEMTMLMEHLQDVEEENKVLKEILVQKAGDENNSNSSFFRPSEADSQLAGPYIFSEHVPHSKTSSDAGKDCRILSSQSSASSSLSELDQCKHEDSKNTFMHKMLETSDMSLMDDFLEMEKLAVLVASDQPTSTASGSPENRNILSSALATGITTNGTATGKELVPVGQIDIINNNGGQQMLDISTPSDWIQHVMDIIMTQNRMSGRSLKKLVCDVLMALKEMNSFGDSDGGDDACQALHLVDQQQINGFLTWLPQTSSLQDEHLAEWPEDKNDKNTALSFELQDSKDNIGSLQAELETFGEVDRMIEDQLRYHKSKNQDLTHLTVVTGNLSKALQKLSSIEIELEERRHGCKELEQKCLELQFQLESCIASQDTQEDEDVPENELTQSMSSASTKEREINAASVKLDECQETILELGKQLKALSSSNETNSDPELNYKFSLLEQMQFEDNKEEEKRIKFPTEQHKPTLSHSDKCDTLCDPATYVAPQAIVVSKKRGGTITFLRKLLYRRRRRSSRKLSFSLSS